jgi:glucose 1-dehydrogenase
VGKLDGKVAVVTGSARGIGQGIAWWFASEGADVMVNDLENAELARTVAEEIRGMGRQSDVYIADAGSAEQVQMLVDATIERFGKLDVAVANAVYERHTPFLESNFDNVRRTTEVLLFGAYYLAYSAARHMADRGEGGKILFITSIHGAHSFPNAAAYNMCKAGVNHLARSIAAELTPHHINVNAIEPGWIDTPGERRFYTEEQMQASGSRLPWGRMGQPDDIARAAAYLCSDDADYVTGTVLRVDGGYMASLLPPLKSE